MTARVTLPISSSDDPSVTLSPAERWQTLFGSPAPQRLAGLVELAISWKSQVIAEGDVAPAIRRDLGIIADRAREARGPLATVEAKASGQGGSPDAADNAVVRRVPPLAPPPSSHPRPRSARRPSATAPLPPASSQLTIGTKLVKSYAGKTHVVEVTEAGMRYEGVTYGSLSAVAKVITGTHWNGLLFFGLRTRRTYPKAKR